MTSITPIFCCANVKRLEAASQDSTLPARLHNLINSQQGARPDSADIPLTADFYDKAVLCVVERGVYLPEGTKYSKNGWYAPIVPTGDGTSWFVVISSNKAYKARQERYVEEEPDPKSTSRYGECPNHPDVEYQAKWHTFMMRESDSDSEPEPPLRVVEEKGGYIYSEEEESENAFSENESDQSELEVEAGGSTMFEDQSEQSESESEEEGDASPMSQAIPGQPAAPAIQLSQPPAVQQNAAPPSTSNAPAVQPAAVPNQYQHLVDRVKGGRGLPCDECSRRRRTCSRRLTPGPPTPKCNMCERQNVPCTWNTVGSGARDDRAGR